MSKRFAKMPLEDSPWVEHHAADDVDNYVMYFRGLGAKTVDLLGGDKSDSAQSFLNGAQQAVARFNITTRAHKKTKGTTFRFSEQKEGEQPVTVFIVADASRIEAQRQVLGLIQWCMLQELKRHENHHRPVYLIADEATNFKINDLGSLLTWGRGYGLRLHLILQNLPAFRRTYGKDVLATLLSETEIKQFLPGTREPETLALIEKLLGNESRMAQGRNGNTEARDYWLSGYDYREDGRPLMYSDEIRRMDKAILFVRRNNPLLVDLPPIAAIAPFRDEIDINPFHGKPFLLPVKIRLDRDNPRPLPLFRRITSWLFKRKIRTPAQRKARLIRLAQGVRLASSLVNLWALGLLIAFFLSPIGPHLRTGYQYHQYGTNSPKAGCTYLGARGFISPDLAPRCPLLVFIDARDWR